MVTTLVRVIDDSCMRTDVRLIHLPGDSWWSARCSEHCSSIVTASSIIYAVIWQLKRHRVAFIDLVDISKDKPTLNIRSMHTLVTCDRSHGARYMMSQISSV